MTDILEYMLPDPAWAAEFHLAVAGKGGQPLYTWCDFIKKMIWDMKGSGGFPWDGNSFDEQFIYQNITEVDPASWANASTFSAFASASWPNGNGGIAWASRYFIEGGFNAPIITPDSTYHVYPSCGAAPVVKTLGGPIMTKVEGPLANPPAFGGDLTAIIENEPTLAHSYFYNPGFANMEKNYFVKTRGHCQWELWELVGGIYVLKQTSAFNTQVAGGVPALNFPCGVPVL